MQDLIKLYNIECPHPNEDVMYCYLCKWLQDHNVEYESDGKNIWRLTGKKFILSSHYDMVKTNGRAEHFYIKDNVIKGYNKDYQQTSLGADDKNGIWICMKCIEKGLQPDFIWSFGEEVGLLGIHQLDDAGVLKEHIKENNVCLVLDRKGYGEILNEGGTGKYCNTLAQDLVNFGNSLEFGLKVGSGTMSDAEVLSKYCESTNMSIGYYNGHSSTENTNWEELQKMRDFVVKVLLLFVHYNCPVETYERRSEYEGMGVFGNDWESDYQEDLFRYSTGKDFGNY